MAKKKIKSENLIKSIKLLQKYLRNTSELEYKDDLFELSHLLNVSLPISDRYAQTNKRKHCCACGKPLFDDFIETECEGITCFVHDFCIKKPVQYKFINLGRDGYLKYLEHEVIYLTNIL